jgi:hypothetical protein
MDALSGLSIGHSAPDLWAARPDARDAGERRMFDAALARARKDLAASPQGRAREAAEQLVATSLVNPLLKMVRESTKAVGPFAPGAGERTFGQMQDAIVAQRLVKAAHWPLVDTLAQRMLRDRTTGATPTPAATNP